MLCVSSVFMKSELRATSIRCWVVVFYNYSERVSVDGLQHKLMCVRRDPRSKMRELRSERRRIQCRTDATERKASWPQHPLSTDGQMPNTRKASRCVVERGSLKDTCGVCVHTFDEEEHRALCWYLGA